MARIILVRHGETKLNTSPEMIRGWKDVPLDAHGKQQSKEVAQKLGKLGTVYKIYTSDLQRAGDTADELKEVLNAPLEKMRALRPWDVGALAGVPLDDRVRKYAAKLVVNSSKKAPDGESFSSFVHRFKGAIDKITSKALTSDKPVVVVTHSRNIRVFLTFIESGLSGVFAQPPSKWLAKDEDPVKPGQYVELNFKRDRWVAGEPKNG
jgi:probable phosphoglycerate mutase